MVYADGRLSLRNEAGWVARVVPVEAMPDGYREKGRFRQPHLSDKLVWAYPVAAGRRQYLRDQDILLCYDVRGNTAR